MSDKLEVPRRPPQELMFPSDDVAEERFFAPPKPPGDFSLMMMLPRTPFWRTRAFLYGVGAAVALALVVTLAVAWLSRPGPAQWFEGRWRYAGPEELRVELEVDGGEVSTTIEGVWASSTPYRLLGSGSRSLVIELGGVQSSVRFETPDRMTIETEGEGHPYERIAPR
ncbi:MAG: hypothetical protein AMXMBFR64_33640 [Myxococcales bacterium]